MNLPIPDFCGHFFGKAFGMNTYAEVYSVWTCIGDDYVFSDLKTQHWVVPCLLKSGTTCLETNAKQSVRMQPCDQHFGIGEFAVQVCYRKATVCGK